MTAEELMENAATEDYCLLNGYSIEYRRSIDENVFCRDGSDYRIRPETDMDSLFASMRDNPSEDILSIFVEEIFYPEEDEPGKEPKARFDWP